MAPSVPTVASARPSGNPIAFRTVLAQAPAGGPLTLGAGTYSFDNFVDTGDGADGGDVMTDSLTGIAGAGIDKTIIQMTPHTSTHAGDIPTQPFASNPLALVRVKNGSPNVHDFTVRATDQGHLYNGLEFYYTTNARISNVKVVGVPGNDSKPPGETFGMEEYRADGSVYSNVEVDGAGVSASCFASNHSQNLTVQNGYFHGSAFSHGMALWTVDNANLIDCTCTDNKLVGINLERMSGTVDIVRPVLKNNGECDIGAASDLGSATVNIYDPVLVPGQKLKIGWGPEYMGKPNLQKKSDVHVYENGKDVTDQVVQWV